MKRSPILLVALFASLVFFAMCGTVPVAYATSADHCTVDSLLSTINNSPTQPFGSCGEDQYNDPGSICFTQQGSQYPGVYDTEVSETANGYSSTSCSGPTNYAWQIQANVEGGIAGPDNAFTEAAAGWVGGSMSSGGFLDVESGVWNTYEVEGSCPGYSNLAQCINLKWNVELQMSVPALGTAGDYYDLFIERNYAHSSIIESDELCCGPTSTNYMNVGTDQSLASLGLTLKSGDTITFGEYMEVDLTGGASVVHENNYDGAYLHSTAGCPTFVIPSYECVYLEPVTTGTTFPTPVFPLGSVLALLVPLAALLAYFASSKIRLTKVSERIALKEN